jgi:hypothetical protein
MWEEEERNSEKTNDEKILFLLCPATYGRQTQTIPSVESVNGLPVPDGCLAVTVTAEN